MKSLNDYSLARMNFIVSWKSDNILHKEHYHAADVNMWRDIFPESIRQELIGKKTGEKINQSFFANELIGNSHTSSLSLPMTHWLPPSGKSSPPPFAGRYYPQGFLSGISCIYKQTLTPMRVVAVNGETFTVDLNHPLDGRQLDIEIELKEISQTQKERGGRCSNRLQDVLYNGPGMQARIATNPITFNMETAYLRSNSCNDFSFYSEPRLVSHIDSQASGHLASVTGLFIKPGSRILDLMASVESHLPEGHGFHVTGLGMNRKEMSANKDLSDTMIYDLNEEPNLPFPDKSFDAVICNLSIEYLIHPQDVIRETARVLKPSGSLLISFSNRWFPPKVTRLWTELHEFERMGYVLQLCWPYYDNLHTYSFRNWPRPVTDKYYPQMPTSDPLYVVTGKTKY